MLPYGLLAGFTHTLTIHHFASTWSYKNNFFDYLQIKHTNWDSFKSLKLQLIVFHSTE